MPEALAYGALLGDLKDGKPLDALKKYFDQRLGGAARVSALATITRSARRADLPTVQPFESRGDQGPGVRDRADCKWSCEVAKEGAKDPAKERETKDIKTVGDFVKYCIEPTMQERKPEPPKK